MEYKLEQVLKEKQAMADENHLLHENVERLEVQCQCHLEDKRALKASMNEKQIILTKKEAELHEKEMQITYQASKHQTEVV